LKEQFELLFDSPRFLAVNLISHCNYHCMKCQYHSPEIDKKIQWPKPLSLDQYAIILEKCKKFERLTSVCPTISGEPLLSPDIVEIVRMTKKAGYFCSFATNASLLTRELAIQLIDAGVDGLAFSVDSTRSEVYRHLQGGDLEAVERNILVFKEEWLKRRGSFTGTMVFVVSDENKNETDEYRKKWLELGFTVVFSAQHDITMNYRPFFEHKKWSPATRMPCSALWHCLYVIGDGSIVSCGATAKTHESKENYFTLEPEESWRCHTLQVLREQELNGEKPGYCHDCSCWSGQMNTWVYERGQLVNHTQGSWMELPLQKSIKTEPAVTNESLFRKFCRRIGTCYTGFRNTSLIKNHL
jgi:pyruvate-formate lyase-activating enzyme